MGGVALARGNFGPFSIYVEFPNYPSLETQAGGQESHFLDEIN